MKKLIAPTILIMALAVGGYFLFFYQPEADGTDPNGTEMILPVPEDRVGEEQPKTIKEIVRDTKLKERAQPEKFIEVNSTFKKKFLLGANVEGTIENKAEFTTYLDVELMARYLDEDANPVDSSGFTVFGELLPGRQLTYEFTQKAPKGARSAQVEVREAKIQEEPAE